MAALKFLVGFFVVAVATMIVVYTVSAGPRPQYRTCAEVIAHEQGPYYEGSPEYNWYGDGDKDGIVCERN